MSVHERLFPIGVNTTRLSEATDLHRAAGALQRTMADTSVDKKFTYEQSAQRQQLLTISATIILNERDRILDEFCAAWCRSRGLKL